MSQKAGRRGINKSLVDQLGYLQGIASISDKGAIVNLGKDHKFVVEKFIMSSSFTKLFENTLYLGEDFATTVPPKATIINVNVTTDQIGAILDVASALVNDSLKIWVYSHSIVQDIRTIYITVSYIV